VIVGYDDVFVLNTLLLPLIQEEYGSDANDLQLACISDLDVMGVVIGHNLDIVKMIRDKIDHTDERFYAFIGLWEKKHGTKNLILKRSFDDFMDRMVGDPSHFNTQKAKITTS